MKFIMVYSGGKDCTLALDRMIAKGHEPVCLFTTATRKQLNFKHGIRQEIFRQYEDCLGIPVRFSYGDSVHEKSTIFRDMKEIIEETGATAICTGDIYRADVYEWNRTMADRLGVELMTPLWEEPAEKLLNELLDKGFKCLIKVVRTDRLSVDYLGRFLDREVLTSFPETVDLCGEDGEYHTIVLAGPVFRHPLKVRPGRILSGDDVAMLDLFAGSPDNNPGTDT